MSNQTTNQSSSAGASYTTVPPVFIPPTDPTTGTYLSLGSYEEVFNSDWDYWAIHKALKQDNMTLVKILRIHNNLLKDRLEEELTLVKKGRPPDFDANMQDLFHGTSESLERICYEGLDERLSTSGHFGRGIYFSDRPAICRIQSEKNSPKQPFIVRCKVILGDSKIYRPGESDPSLTREPVKENIDGKNVFHDSVQGKTGDFNQFVVFDKRRAMIQYVIFYTTDAALPSLPPVPPSESKSSRRKKKKRESERRSGGSPRNETPRRAADEDSQSGSDHSSSLSGSDRTILSSPSSDSNYSDDEDSSHLGAVGGRPVPRSSSSREQSEQTSVPKAKSTRERTRRLMSEDIPPSNVVAVGAAASSSASGAAVGPDPSSVDVYRKKMQELAMKQMLDLKGRVPQDKISELWEDYSRTYGSGMFGDAEENFQSSDRDFAESDDVQAVIDLLVEEFRQIIPGIDSQTARQYIVQNEMDINRAMSAYFDNS